MLNTTPCVQAAGMHMKGRLQVPAGRLLFHMWYLVVLGMCHASRMVLSPVRSPWRPVELAAAHHMQVHVVHRLACIHAHSRHMAGQGRDCSCDRRHVLHAVPQHGNNNWLGSLGWTCTLFCKQG
jgi:hypothetical protein